MNYLKNNSQNSNRDPKVLHVHVLNLHKLKKLDVKDTFPAKLIIKTWNGKHKWAQSYLENWCCNNQKPRAKTYRVMSQNVSKEHIVTIPHGWEPGCLSQGHRATFGPLLEITNDTKHKPRGRLLVSSPADASGWEGLTSFWTTLGWPVAEPTAGFDPPTLPICSGETSGSCLEERLRLYALASLADCASSASLSKYIAAGTLGRLVGWILINSLADQYRQFSSGLWYERGTPPKLSVATKDVLHCLLQTIFSLQDCPRTWYGR